MPEGWQWDETLYRGAAPFYARGRLPYASGLADRLASVLAWDGDGRLLDVGCGPGILTLMLARRFAEAVGVDPDRGMLAEAERRATAAGIGNVRWVQTRAEELPAGLGSGTFRVATFGQSFHWMDRPRVAAIVYDLLEPGGAFVHVSDVKEPQVGRGDLPHPNPPYEAIGALVRRYLGPTRRAGQGVLMHGTPAGEAAVLSEAGFVEFERLLVPADEIVVRAVDDLIAWVYSQSSSAPHLFGDRIGTFETDLRRLLHEASPSERLAEYVPDTEVFVWRKPRR